MKSLNQFELKDISHIDMKEQIGIGNFTKSVLYYTCYYYYYCYYCCCYYNYRVMRAVLTSTMADLQEGSEVAVKILDGT